MKDIRIEQFLPLCVFSLIYSIDSAIQGIISAIALLFFYPLLVIAAITAHKFLKTEKAYLLTVFLSVLLMSLYLNFIASMDSAAVEGILYKVPASMVAGPFIILGLEGLDSRLAAQRERRMMREGLILALLVALFAVMRDFFLHGTADLRFAGWGEVVSVADASGYGHARALSFFCMAGILGILSFFEEQPHA